MADRVSASIEIGGTITAAQFDRLCELIARYDLGVDWDGEPFARELLREGKPLRLCAHETSWGCFNDLEQYCCDEGIAYRRWSGACPGSFGAERVVHDGKSGPLNFAVDDNDTVVLDESMIGRLGSMRAIRRYLAEAEIELLPFAVVEVLPTA